MLRWAKKLGIVKFEALPERFTDRQLEIITGSLLGDGSLRKVYNTSKMNSLFTEKHCIKQRDYLNWKFDELMPFSVAKYDDHSYGLMTNGKSKGISY